jgi:succinate dehydrogenase flavin-adding protein (antitoxin of CptAB toxin-antitoxin module)
MEAIQHAPRRVGLDTEEIISDRIASGECIVVRRKTLVYLPPCTCAICETQYRMYERQKVEGFTYSNVLGGQEADALLERHVAGMKKDQECLRKMLLCYDNALLDWWRRRRPTGRKAFLEQMVPELASTKEIEADYHSKRFRPEEV